MGKLTLDKINEMLLYQLGINENLINRIKKLETKVKSLEVKIDNE